MNNYEVVRRVEDPTLRAYALVYPPQYLTADENKLAFPSHPDSITELKFGWLYINSASTALPPEAPIVFKTNPEEDIVTVLGNLVYRIHQQNVSGFFTVHAKSSLLRVYRWYWLRKYHSTMVSSHLSDVTKITVDLCEAFHYPAVLTYQDRIGFGTQDIQEWLKISTSDLDTEHALLHALAARTQ